MDVDPAEALRELQDVALIDARAAAAAASVGLSKFYAMVAEGKAPQPVIRATRFTRWRLADVREWLQQLPELHGTSEAAEKLRRSTGKASAANQRKRLARKIAGALEGGAS